MHEVAVQPLTREAFAPFGDVIETDGAEHFPINDGTTERYNDLGDVQLRGDGARALINIFRGQPFTPPVTVTRLERHPLGSQAFVPLDGRPYLVVVAAGEAPGRDDIHAFLARGDQGVNYHANTWHHALLALEAESDFVVVDRGGPGDNCETYDLPEAVIVTT